MGCLVNADISAVAMVIPAEGHLLVRRPVHVRGYRLSSWNRAPSVATAWIVSAVDKRSVSRSFIIAKLPGGTRLPFPSIRDYFAAMTSPPVGR